MDNKFIEKQMLDLKEQIKVNNDLKRNLRSSFDKKTVKRWKLPVAVAVAAVICVVMVSYLGSPRVYVNHVNAASIKILNQVSFADIGEASGDAAEYKGTVYNAVFGQGIYAYDSNGYREIYKGEVNALNVSPDGKKLVFSDGNLNIFDIETSKATVLLKGDESTYYEQPAWASDNKHIIYVKKVIEPLETHGFEETESSICQIDLENMDVKKLADGNSPSYAGKGNIVFERDGNIIRKNIKDQSEKIIDTGRFPSVSPDGGYVAYVKTEKREKAISAKLSVEENIDNVWIADVNFETKKQLTMNFVEDEEMSEDEIAENTSDLPMSILKTGMYSYYNPKWSSDSKNLYVLKNNNKTRNMKLMRISFTDSELTAENTVANFIQALISREDDYAKSLMHNPPDLITVSNPRIVGYKILKSGSENGKLCIEAETYWSYKAQPDFQVLKQNYYLSSLNSGYIIDEIITEDELAVGVSKDGQSLVMKKEKDQILFNINDIPKNYLSEENYRIASLAFSEEGNSVIFSIQVLEDDAQKSSVKVLAYDIRNKEFKFIDHIKNINGKENVVIESLISDSSGRYAAVKLFSSDDPDFKTTVLVYDLKNNKKADIGSLLKYADMGAIHTKFWDKNVLVLELAGEGQTMSYLYNPENGELKSFGEN
ncbi:TolB family protein [Acetivibrio clariflavus]|uniref:WD40-like Beta Propeller Repeat n=1 Tax=Acetivibrio clariflavus (strain DSM 19732 / NBRC 101661 / EBR45) TaxID=720554 RepID=G8LXD9_ACECE|nr:hypothetical protein [Acetivibrio clariflavus]AEV69857.1 hypothetical protein Clocl_3358 [Acetivibrio clariflavus DSM 19732]